MPVTIQTNKVKFKDPNNQGFITLDAIGSESAQEIQSKISSDVSNAIKNLNDAAAAANASADTIAQAVSRAVAQGTDATLALSGLPADAKATGDSITDLKNTISEDQLRDNFYSYFRLRGWTDEGFKNYNARLSTVVPVYCPFDIYIDANDVTDSISSLILLVFNASYAGTSSYVSQTLYNIGVNGRNIVKIPANTYACISLAQSGNANFSSIDVANNIKISFSNIIDDSLSITDAAADAKVVGDAVTLINDNLDAHDRRIEDLNNARNNIDGTIQYAYTPDAYITVNQNVNVSVPLTTVPTTGAGYAIIDCSPGDTFLVAGKGWNASRVYAFLTSGDKMILKAVNGADINGLVITAPNNAAKLVVNNVDSSHSHYVIKLPDHKRKTDLSDANEIYTRGAEISNTVTENTFVDFEAGIRTFTNHPEYCTAEYSVTPDSYYYVTGSCQYADHSVYRLIDADGNYSGSYDSTNSNVVSLTNKLVYIPKGVTKIQLASVKGSSGLSLYPALLSKDGLPNYYYENGYFQNKLKEIQSGMDFSYGICFAFITDTHWPSNSGHSKNMLAQILKKTSVPFVVFGGDLAPAYADEDNLNKSVSTLFDYMDAVGSENWYSVHGNHDIYSRESSESSTYYRKTLAECYNIMMRKQERIIGNGDPYHCYYYFDIASPDTRIIVLNSSDITTPNGSCAYTKWQVKGLAVHLQSVSNKNIIIISHLSPDSVLADTEANDTKDVRDLLSAYQNRSTFVYDGTTYNFSNATNKIIFSLAGHSHSDGYHFENNILSVTTTCDAYYKDDGYNATPGTTTEQAFDIFYIDYNNKTVKTIRVGRGNNRAWNYETGEVVT